MNKKEEFGKRLKIARKFANVSQKKLSTLCGWGSGDSASARISQYERGEREPNLADIELMSNATGVPPEWLAFGKGSPPLLAEKNKSFKTLSFEPLYDIQPLTITSNIDTELSKIDN